jgi:hypothetical protein
LFKEVAGKTCSMATLDPSLNDEIESGKKVFDYQKAIASFVLDGFFTAP